MIFSYLYGNINKLNFNDYEGTVFIYFAIPVRFVYRR